MLLEGRKEEQKICGQSGEIRFIEKGSFSDTELSYRKRGVWLLA